MANKPLTSGELATLASALNRAMDDRQGFAECNAPGTPEHKAALALVRKYERLHVRIFGRPSGRATMIKAMNAVPSKSIFPERKPEQ